MKKLLTLIICSIAIVACEKQDACTQAIKAIYNNCIESGQHEKWCRCIRADLINSPNLFTEEMAVLLLQGREHPLLNTAFLGAKVRCECRINPQRVAKYGLSCANVKQISF